MKDKDRRLVAKVFDIEKWQDIGTFTRCKHYRREWYELQIGDTVEKFDGLGKFTERFCELLKNGVVLVNDQKN